MNSFTAHLVCCTSVILNEIASKQCKRRDIAQTYRLAMESEKAGVDKPDWAQINRAIVERWSLSALTWIKEQAHSGKCFAPKGGAA